ncbi:hypothetical protein V6N13_116160 [Hibiscus sabdariffa]|uniref:Uncharacterized protein n=2 Tax=Hibiscus sabdariffa TaxID=183260 RepID=A0ABR2BQ56_9ROSI
MTTKAYVPDFRVDVEHIRCPIPLHATVKQGSPPKGGAKVKLKVVAVSDMSDAEIVVFRFAMDDEIHFRGQVVIDQHLRFVWQKTRSAHS